MSDAFIYGFPSTKDLFISLRPGMQLITYVKWGATWSLQIVSNLFTQIPILERKYFMEVYTIVQNWPITQKVRGWPNIQLSIALLPSPS